MKKENKSTNNKFINFKSWKIKTKIIVGFLFIAILSGVINYISTSYLVNRISNLNHASHLIHQITINQKEIDLKVRTYLFSDDTNAIPDINFDNENKEVKQSLMMYKKMTGNTSRLVFMAEERSMEFLKISAETIEMHKEHIEYNNILKKTLSEEKEKRYTIKKHINASDNFELREKYALMMYYGKEALYQYKDESHLKEWDDAIHLLLDNFIKSGDKNLAAEMKDYSLYSHTLSIALINSENNRKKELVKIEELEKIEKDISLIQEQVNIVQAIKQNNIDRISNILSLSFVLGLMILVISIGYFLSNTISEPIKNLAKSASEIASGNYKKRISVSSDNEIGKTATTINLMLDKLEEVREVLEIKVKARTKNLEILANNLENQVEERTKELKEKLKEVEKFNDLSIGRELKMIELKNDIKNLKKNNLHSPKNKKEETREKKEDVNSDNDIIL